ncbi:hypothetical protein P73_0382 [Celeribacter indicus]|uniref:Uncharacterized protein n=2 Tax=Celeribacter indicus TaxID=1208324 RepID=A0A0B5DY01_9RHOB|nr:hypothetical protein P73_0382 [Celeribacter indicus]
MTVLCLAPAFASAECYASYKAKRDDPLQLHFGVAEVGDGNCSKEAAGKVLAGRLARDGWILLSIVEMIPADRLGEVKDRAGDYFLRY